MQPVARLCGLTVGLSLGLMGLGAAIDSETNPAMALVPAAGEAPTAKVAEPPLDGQLSKADPQAYTRAMMIGYAAAERGDYHTALINFRRALAERPGNQYALDAIDNMETYIARERAEARRRAEIARLQEVLSQAVQSNDWACAATSVERLVQLVPPDSVDRDRLIAYRGEIGGLIESRANLDQWSTVCLGGSPE